jgi:tetratricopeptide (TPR) repeat protein
MPFEKEKETKRCLSQWVIFLLIGVLIGLLYFNSLSNQFTNWDDGMIYANPQIRSLAWGNIHRIFSYVKGATYQPVRILSYAFDYSLWGLEPFGYHMTSVFFYVLTCIMVFLSLQKLSKHLREKEGDDSHFRMALFGSLVFAAHPVHVEAVTWLAARKEVLQGFFFFAAFFLYLKARETDGVGRGIFFGLLLLSVLLATLSKPSAVVFPGVILVYEIARSRDLGLKFVRRHWLFFALALLISFVFAGILVKVMLDAGGLKPYRGGTFSTNLIHSVYAFLYNIKLLVFTVNYSASYTLDVPRPILGLRTLLFMAVILILLGWSIWSLKKTRVFFFSFFFFVVTVFPYLNIVPISTLLADRYVFIASFSYCLLIGVAFDKLYRLQRARFSQGFFKVLSVALFVFLLAFYSFMTIRQNSIWENSFTLWADAVEKYPESNTANALMGVVYMDLGMDQEAVKYLEKAVQVLPQDYQSRNNLGIVYGRVGEPQKALREFMTALWLLPGNDTVRINLSVFYQRYGEYKKAEEILRYLLNKYPGNGNYHYRLALVFKDKGDYQGALSELMRAKELAPRVITIYEELGNIYASRLNDLERAKFYYAQGVEIAPNSRGRVETLRWMIQDLESQ